MTTKSSFFLKRAAKAAAFALTVFVFSVGGLSCDALLQEKGAYLLELNDKIDAVKEENAVLTREVASLSSPRRICEVAEKDLGMVRAEEKDRVYVEWAEMPAAEKEEPQGGLYAAVTRFLGEDAPERQ
ncbi:MAG: septum formation initiator family protein [Clostridia bacterium]